LGAATLAADGVGAYDVSPDGGTVVLGGGSPAHLRFVDVRGLRPRGRELTLPRADWVSALAWVTRERVIVLDEGASAVVSIVDRTGPRLLRSTRLPGGVVTTAAVGTRLVVLLAPRSSIGTARLVVADSSGGVRSVALPGISAGTERTESSGDAQAMRSVSPGLAVAPDASRALVVPAGDRVAEVDLDSLRVEFHELSRRTSIIERLRSWIEPRAQAKIVDGPSRLAFWLDGRYVALTGMDLHGLRDDEWHASSVGLHLIDTRAWSVRTLAEDVNSAAFARDLLLAFTGAWPEGSKGTGLSAYGPDGNERFHLFGHEQLSRVEAAWPYAYVYRGREGRRLDVVDLRSGRVVRSRTSGPEITIVG
jgi:hypothetical protein